MILDSVGRYVKYEFECIKQKFFCNSEVALKE